MLKWCPCMGWCLSDTSTGGEAKVLLNPMATPAYNVRRISSFGQTIINDAGVEEEIARHGSLPTAIVTTHESSHNGKVWSTTLAPVQPGVTKADMAGRVQKMASIPEKLSPKAPQRLRKCHSDDTDRTEPVVSSPVRPRRRVPDPQEFSKPLPQKDESEPSSIISEATSEDKIKVEREENCEKARAPEIEISPPQPDPPSPQLKVKVNEEQAPKVKSSQPRSIFSLVKSVKSVTLDKPISPWSKRRGSDISVKSTKSLRSSMKLKSTEDEITIEEDDKAASEPGLSRKGSVQSRKGSGQSERSVEGRIVEEEVTVEENRAAVEDKRVSLEERKNPLEKSASVEEKKTSLEKKASVEEKKVTVEEKKISLEKKASVEKNVPLEVEVEEMGEGETEDSDEEDRASQTASQATTHLADEELEEVALDSKAMDSAEIAKQYGLDLSLYEMSDTITAANRNGDDLSADTSVAMIHFTTKLDKDKNQLQITLDRLEGMGGQGPKNMEFESVVKMSFLKGGHTHTSKPFPSSKPASQAFSLHVKDLATSILRLSVYNASWQGSHDALGHALFRVSKCAQSISHHTLNVSPKSNISESAGLIELSFRLQSNILYIIVHKVSDLLPTYRGSKVYTKIAYYSQSKKMKEKVSKPVESGEKGTATFDFESRFKVDAGFAELHHFVLVSLKKKADNSKLFKNDKTLGRVYLGPLLHTGRKINLWGQAVLQAKIMTHTFSLYN